MPDYEIFSEMQDIWDSNKDKSHINLVLCGSIYSKMKEIFDDKDEPLYGRCTARFSIRPFSTATLKEILGDFNPGYTPDDLLCLYMITGGVARYVEQLMSQGAFTKDDMIDCTFELGSYFIDEAREMLSDEFGRDYGNYFSILAALASGNTTRGEIKNYIRFIYKYRSAVEIRNLKYVRDKVLADYETYSGIVLERYFRQQYKETGLYNVVASYWDKDGKDEIDLVAVNEAEHKIVIGEVKRNPDRIDLHILKEKSAKILDRHKGWSVTLAGLSMKDIN